MKTNFEKLCTIIADSKLSSAEQKSLENLFAEAEDKELAPIIELFTEDPGWIKKTSENYIRKYKALTTQNQNEWETIVSEEETLLKSL